MQRYEKKYNSGNIITLVSALLSLAACFLPFFQGRYVYYNYADICGELEKEAERGTKDFGWIFVLAFYVAIVGAILVAVLSLIKSNGLCVLISTIVLVVNGTAIVLLVVGLVHEIGVSAYGVGFYFFVLATLMMFIGSIMGAAQNSRAKTRYYMENASYSHAYVNGGTSPYAQPVRSYGQPQMQQPQRPYGQPMMQQPQAPYGQPMMQQSQAPYGQPMMQQPQRPYGQPMMQQPQAPYGQPQMQQPQQPQAPYGQPQMQQPQAPYGQPMMQQSQQPQQPQAPVQPAPQSKEEEKVADSAFDIPKSEDPAFAVPENGDSAFTVQGFDASQDEEETMLLEQTLVNDWAKADEQNNQ